MQFPEQTLNPSTHRTHHIIHTFHANRHTPQMVYAPTTFHTIHDNASSDNGHYPPKRTSDNYTFVANFPFFYFFGNRPPRGALSRVELGCRMAGPENALFRALLVCRRGVWGPSMARRRFDMPGAIKDDSEGWNVAFYIVLSYFEPFWRRGTLLDWWDSRVCTGIIEEFRFVLCIFMVWNVIRLLVWLE